MGLFISNNKHQNIYKNDAIRDEPNQVIFRRDHLADLLEAQREEYNLLQQSILKLHLCSDQQDSKQIRKLLDISSQLRLLKSKDLKHEETEDAILEQLTTLVEVNQKLHQDLARSNSSDQMYLSQLEQVSLANKEILNYLAEQRNTQENVLKRLENQEALTEKILRQMNNLRSVIFERTTFLVEKVDDGFKLTSSYLYQLLTGTDQSFMLYMPHKKKK